MSDSYTMKLKAEASKVRPKNLSDRQAVIAGCFCCAAQEGTGHAARSVKLTKETTAQMADLLSKEGFQHLVKGAKIEVLPEAFEKCDELLSICFKKVSEDMLSSNRDFTRAFLRGAFLSSGYCADPEKNYRIELHCKNNAITEVLIWMLHSVGIEPSVSMRDSYNMIYFKSGDNVSDFIGLIGASNSMMEFENVRAAHELNSYVTRTVNCDAGNSRRQSEASAQRTESFQRLVNSGESKKLPKELQDVIRVSLENPGASIAELGRMMDPPIGKSGMNHRIIRIIDVAKSTV